jgi:acyl carrier protein
MNSDTPLTGRSEILARVVRVIADCLERDPTELSSETRIRQDLGADSMQVVTIIIGLDEEFDAEFDIDKVPKDDATIDGIVDLVTTTLAGNR